MHAVFYLRVLPMVLIDTWWNVNTYGELMFDKGDGVLIDTWWNVN